MWQTTKTHTHTQKWEGFKWANWESEWLNDDSSHSHRGSEPRTTGFKVKLLPGWDASLL